MSLPFALCVHGDEWRRRRALLVLLQISAARRGTQARSFPTSHRRARPTSPERAPETAERASWNNGGLAQRLNAAEASAGSGAQPAGDDVVDVGAEVEASGGRRLGCWVSGGNALSSTVPPDTHHRAPLPSGGPELGQGPEGHASGTMVTLPRTFALPSTMDPLLRAERGSPTGWEALTEWKDPQTKQTTFAPLMATSSSSRSNSRNLSAQVCDQTFRVNSRQSRFVRIAACLMIS